MAKAVYLEVNKREYDNKFEVWGMYPIHQVKGMDAPYTRKFPVFVQMLAKVCDNASQAKRFMKENLRKY
jgi:hypothetical protein